LVSNKKLSIEKEFTSSAVGAAFKTSSKIGTFKRVLAKARKFFRSKKKQTKITNLKFATCKIGKHGNNEMCDHVQKF
jgi:hypothetical protein